MELLFEDLIYYDENNPKEKIFSRNAKGQFVLYKDPPGILVTDKNYNLVNFVLTPPYTPILLWLWSHMEFKKTTVLKPLTQSEVDEIKKDWLNYFGREK